MPLTQESLDNFQRGAVGDSFLGVVVYDQNANTYTIHLSLAVRLDGVQIEQDRYSRIGGIIRAPLPAAGGHAQIVNWAGGQAQQIAQGQAIGQAIGFSIVKSAANAFKPGTFRSGFNSQHAGDRPGFAKGTDNEARTLRESDIWPLLHELTQPLMGGRVRRHSIS
jgi:hypothetical protein